MSTVDVHTHALLPAVEAFVGELDPEGLAAARALDGRRNGSLSSAESGRMIKERWALLTDLATRLSAM
ncbi:MAG TPA: amidohydrolase, partial [Williamsia sp.]